MTEMPYLCWAFLYTSTGVNSYMICFLFFLSLKKNIQFPFFLTSRRSQLLFFPFLKYDNPFFDNKVI
ncbi:hypothetical protein DXK91_02265 [Parageobacillus toebii]|nr:hypothetical protein DXK91_02265 [Parageobacillus toebii]